MAAAREVIRIAFRAFVGSDARAGRAALRSADSSELERDGLLILANHPTLIDTVFLMAFVQNADCIVKGGLWNNPFTAVRCGRPGYINNDLGAALVDDCIASLRMRNNLIMFPEGTRTPAAGAIS
jgi:1-acyl-sn-glycerol-3-phosphate acyltransferase